MKLHPIVAVMAVAALTAPAWAQEAPKLSVAVIDVQVLVQDSTAGKEAQARLGKLRDEKTAQGKKLQEERDGLTKQLETQRATLTDAKVAELQKQIEDKDISLRRFADDAQQQVQEATRKELAKLEKKIMPIINEIGREKKYTLIFNKFQAGLVFADEAVDITDEVLKRFNTKVVK
jgi:outer membrane protein